MTIQRGMIISLVKVKGGATNNGTRTAGINQDHPEQTGTHGHSNHFHWPLRLSTLYIGLIFIHRLLFTMSKNIFFQACGYCLMDEIQVLNFFPL